MFDLVDANCIGHILQISIEQRYLVLNTCIVRAGLRSDASLCRIS